MKIRLPKLLRRGFTLVELMVAVTLLGLIVGVIFSLFASTSDTLKEADSLADTLDRTRFAMERLSAEVRNAGSFGSPDSQGDRWYPSVNNAGSSSVRLAGVASYNGWQNDHTLLTTHGLDAAHTDSAVSGSVPAVGYDGFIVMGAIDFPQSFEITSLTFNSGNERVKGATIPANERGMFKLLVNNPFHTDPGLPQGIVPDDSADAGGDALKLSEASAVLTNDLSDRLIRVMDREGNSQVSGIAADPVPTYSDTAIPAASLGGIPIEFTTNLLVRNNEADDSAGADHAVGLQRQTEDNQDIGYDAALIDVYWYHVESDPRDPLNFRLVRERLNGDGIASELATNPNAITTTKLEGLATGDKVVIADRVVDFQVWFDCAGNAQGELAGAAWLTEWANPGGGACMDPNTGEFGEARMAHIRLSVRTKYERKDAPDNIKAFFMDSTGTVNKEMSMRYFDVNPDAEGAARVVTVQSDVELATFSMRNVVY
ncbi:prepilin-type N-terminal cleavage/methylation domain-containing protein [Persicimonas caeni]|uniref:Prepilin-type N-terminal cleavage/methylation domain-containing protein n=1 Tax=Persicimonas caeni TaxID=2292766 RepID=A0A4Y6PRX3_PERCE|nr:prepilin-type N-terminal cleavage/methylation domain-containing protein [Persicimonas caeni]QDG50767.1 prepilin-type N-terminal cleavage/methylation domain-containing protein [Persicimonas caeni]QED31988.1 prepilin-type N-terminal cleavage/methylation domain-containing protein [Persicimonas caeni]